MPFDEIEKQATSDNLETQGLVGSSDQVVLKELVLARDVVDHMTEGQPSNPSSEVVQAMSVLAKAAIVAGAFVVDAVDAAPALVPCNAEPVPNWHLTNWTHPSQQIP